MLRVESNRKRDGCCSSVGDISHGSHLVMADGGLKVFLLPLSRETIERIKSKAKENGSLNVEQTFSFASFRYFYALRVRFDIDQTLAGAGATFHSIPFMLASQGKRNDGNDNIVQTGSSSEGKK